MLDPIHIAWQDETLRSAGVAFFLSGDVDGVKSDTQSIRNSVVDAGASCQWASM